LFSGRSPPLLIFPLEVQERDEHIIVKGGLANNTAENEGMGIPQQNNEEGLVNH